MQGSLVGWQHAMDAYRLAVGRDDRAAAEAALRDAVREAEHAPPGQEDARDALADALLRLGELLMEGGRGADGEACFRRALETRERTVAHDDPALAPALTALASAYVARGAAPQAEPLLLRLLEIKRRKGEDHPEVATVLASLASVRQALGSHESAEQLWRRVVEIRTQVLAPNHLLVANALERLAECESARGRPDEAARHLRRAIAVREATLGVGHATVRAAQERLSDLQLQATGEMAAVLPPPRITRPTAESAALAAAVSSMAGPPPAPDVAPPPPSAPSPSTPPAPVGLEPAAVGSYAPQPTPQPALQPALQPAPLAPPAAPPLSLVRDDAPAWTPTAGSPRALLLPGADGQPLQQLLLDIDRELNEQEDTPVGSPGARLLTGLGERLRTPAAATVGVGVLVLVTVAALWRREPAAEPAEFGASLATEAHASPPPVLAGAPPGAIDSLAASPLVHAADGAIAEHDAASRPVPVSRAPAPERRAEGTAERTAPPTREAPAPAAARASTGLPAATTVPMVNVGLPSDAVTRALLPGADLVPRNARVLGASDGNGNATPAAQPARLIGTVPVARYPETLREARVEGTVRVTFEVDTLGFPDMGTFTVLSSDHRLFTSAVRVVVPSMRFVPAEANGKRVRWLVRMPFEFAVSKTR